MNNAKIRASGNKWLEWMGNARSRVIEGNGEKYIRSPGSGMRD